MLTVVELQELALEDSDKIRELAEIRSRGEDEHFYKYLLQQGVIYGTTVEELAERLLQFDIQLSDLQIKNDKLVEEGWLFPVYDMTGEWLYWVNYSNTRSSNKKYMNIVRTFQHNKMVFGLDTVPQAIQDKRLVWVEGVIDQCRLASQGIPAVATLGTTVTDYMKALSRRVGANVIIPDNDDNGKTDIGKGFGEKLQGELTNARTLKLSYVKDIDECFSVSPEQFEYLINELRVGN